MSSQNLTEQPRICIYINVYVIQKFMQATSMYTLKCISDTEGVYIHHHYFQLMMIPTIDDIFHIIHTTITNFDIVFVEKFMIWFLSKCLFRSLKNVFPTFVSTFLL